MATNPSRWTRASDVFHRAIALPEADRLSFIARECGDDMALRAEVESLVHAHRDATLIGHGPALSAGARIGPYDIVGFIAAGAMGEVYCAHDTTLGRDVALKILPAQFLADPNRCARFEREARLLASFNHPHIANIYGIANHGGIHALVLELVEGETLADRINRGPLPVSDAFDIACQIADGLDAAHEKGVVHRDLKPANLKITPDGSVKILDFGLAKLMSSEGLADDDRLPATVVATQPGLIVGTPSYMSPEQARGLAVDRRADMWAFGCVLFEMLAGRPAFSGATISDTVAAVLGQQPDWDALPTIPSAVLRTLQRCLDKDPRRRIRSAADTRIEIEDAGRTAVPERTANARRHYKGLERRTIAVGLSGAIVVLGAIASLRLWRSPMTPTSSELRLDIVTPGILDPFSMALSPDGRQLAFAAIDEAGSRLWVRSLARSVATPIAGTENATRPFWSPDANSLGFFADGKLKRIDLGTDQPRILADAIPGAGGVGGGTWSNGGLILFTSNDRLFKVPASGGKAEQVGGFPQLSSPQFLPDGRRLLFHVTRGTASGTVGSQGIWLGSFNGPPKHLVDAASSVAYVQPGFLLYVRRGGALVAHRFDDKREQLIDDPIVAADPVGLFVAGAPVGAFSASTSGVLAYQAAGQQYRWTQFDRTGKIVRAAGDSSDAAAGGQDPALSPDGQRLAVTRSIDGNRDIWVIELSRGVATRLTFGMTPETDPTWSPDGGRIAFRSVNGLHVVDIGGGAHDETLLKSATVKWPQDWSADGRFLLYADRAPETGRDLWVLPLAGDRTPRVVVNTPFSEWNGQFSPDGGWIAYQSDQSGRNEIYVRPFQVQGSEQRLSRDGGSMPRWRRDGQELYFIAPGGVLMAVPIQHAGSTLISGQPKPLFQTGTGPTEVRSTYAIDNDGLFLLNAPQRGGVLSPITVILNWAGWRN